MGPENVSPDLFPPDAERSETILARFNQLIGPKNKKYK
jgi:hypothetical protein